MGKVLAVLLALSLLGAFDYYLNWILLDLVWDGSLTIVPFFKSMFSWLFRLLGSLRFYDLLWLVFIPRIKGFFLVDIWKRIFIKGIAPIIFLDARNRRLIAARIGLLVILVKGVVRAVGAAIFLRLERWFGRHAKTVLIAGLSVLVFGVIYVTYGVWFVVGLIPIPRWVSSRLWSMVRFVDGFMRKLLFRMAMILGLMKLVSYLSRRIPDRIIRPFVRARRRALRVLIKRRRRASGQLRRVSGWVRVVATWLAFWDMVFRRVEARTQRYKNNKEGTQT